MNHSQHSVTLEILRHGPSHNQLLSPLTQYLALCGNFGATTVHVPFEHNQFRARLRPLMYQESPLLRSLQLQETSVDMRNILAGVPGLIAALTETGAKTRSAAFVRTADDGAYNHDTDAPTHLELVLSASELAMLPFELAESPPGCPGAGKPLLLQSQMPICLTRRVRHNHREEVSWKRKPRILFVAAAPGTTIPLQEHVDALVSILQPWVDRSRYDGSDPETAYSDCLRVLTQATWSTIESTIAKALEENPPRPFTHIHILAHGVEVREGGSSQFGIQLHHPADPSLAQNITAQQLALALRPAGKQGTAGFSCPAVVTLASCNSGSQKSVVGAGASVAHALHESGIPLVIASQFPLTFGGSVIMTKLLYHGFMRGQDPRVLITRLRRELRGKMAESHDWASIVAYADFGSDLSLQLREQRFLRAKDSAVLALQSFDNYAMNILKHKSSHYENHQSADQLTRLSELITWLNAAFERLERVELESKQVDGINVNGLMAATAKKIAAIEFYKLDAARSARDSKMGRPTADELRSVLRHLRMARDRYGKAWEFDRLATWGQVQELLLSVILNDKPLVVLQHMWGQATNAAVWQLADPQQRAIALRNQIELALLAIVVPGLDKQQSTVRRAGTRINNLMSQFLESVSSLDPEVKSLFEQLLRYQELFPEVSRALLEVDPPSQQNDRKSFTKVSTWRTITQIASKLNERIEAYRSCIAYLPSQRTNRSNTVSTARRSKKAATRDNQS